MRRVFLGKPFHWLLLVAMIVPLIWMGYLHLHVSQFNTYIVLLLLLVALLLALILVPHKHGEQITREPLTDDE